MLKAAAESGVVNARVHVLLDTGCWPIDRRYPERLESRALNETLETIVCQWRRPNGITMDR